MKQGRIAAWNMLGEQQSWRTVSYFFSDVFDLTFNVVGSTEQTDERILRGATKDRSFSVLFSTSTTKRYVGPSSLNNHSLKRRQLAR